MKTIVFVGFYYYFFILETKVSSILMIFGTMMPLVPLINSPKNAWPWPNFQGHRSFFVYFYKKCHFYISETAQAMIVRVRYNMTDLMPTKIMNFVWIKNGKFSWFFKKCSFRNKSSVTGCAKSTSDIKVLMTSKGVQCFCPKRIEIWKKNL
jgi:hypothetical protein